MYIAPIKLTRGNNAGERVAKTGDRLGAGLRPQGKTFGDSIGPAACLEAAPYPGLNIYIIC